MYSKKWGNSVLFKKIKDKLKDWKMDGGTWQIGL